MINKMFSLYDKVRECYEPPIVAENAGVAMRYANERLKQIHDDLKNDFELYQVGEYNHTTGEVKNTDNVHIEKAPSLTELKVTEKNDGINKPVSKHRSA